MVNQKRKIYFIEPHASLGGHMWKNVTCLQKQVHAEFIPYAFVVERDVDIPDYGFLDPCLSQSAVVRAMPRDQQVDVRVNEYKKLFENTDSTIYVFLSNPKFDLAFWHALLKDALFQKTVIEKDHVIIIHNTALTHELFELLNDIRDHFALLGKNVFFSFFSEMQPEIAKKRSGFNNFFTLFESAYEDFAFHTKPHDVDSRYLSYLGFYSPAKSPGSIIDLFRDLKRDPYCIHFYPLGPQNVFSAIDLMRTKRAQDRLHFRKLDGEEYVNAVLATKIGLLPYSADNYAVQASGLLEEYLFAGVPVVVPADTWLSFFLKKIGGGGALFDSHKPGDFREKVVEVLEHYETHKRKAVAAAERIFRERNTHAFLEVIYSLAKTRQCNDLLSPDEKSIYETVLSHGETFFDSGNVLHTKALQFDDVYDPKYCTHLIHQNEAEIQDPLFADFFLKSAHLMKEEKHAEWQNVLHTGIALLEKKKEKSILDIYRLASEYKTVGNYSVANTYFKNIINSTRDDTLVAGAYFHSGDIAYRKEDFDSASVFFLKCIAMNPAHKKARTLYETILERKHVRA